MWYYNQKYVDFDELIGETITDITGLGSDNVTIQTESGRKFRMWHQQDCCERVSIEKIVGNIQSIIGSRIESTRKSSFRGDRGESSTVTQFYIGTEHGDDVLIEWLGCSNGYYGEGVSFGEITDEDQ